MTTSSAYLAVALTATGWLFVNVSLLVLAISYARKDRPWQQAFKPEEYDVGSAGEKQRRRVAKMRRAARVFALLGLCLIGLAEGIRRLREVGALG